MVDETADKRGNKKGQVTDAPNRVKKSRSKPPKDDIARSLNPYMFFVKDRSGPLREQHPGLPQCEIVKIIGKEWVTADDATKKPYRDAAEKAKKEYEKKHPGRKYQPRRPWEIRRRNNSKKAAKMVLASKKTAKSVSSSKKAVLSANVNAASPMHSTEAPATYYREAENDSGGRDMHSYDNPAPSLNSGPPFQFQGRDHVSDLNARYNAANSGIDLSGVVYPAPDGPQNNQGMSAYSAAGAAGNMDGSSYVDLRTMSISDDLDAFHIENWFSAQEPWI